MNLKEKSEALIGLLANKELKFGCVVETSQYKNLGKMVLIRNDYGTKAGDWQVLNGVSTFYQNEKDMRIIGSPVMLGDVLEKFLFLNLAEINGMNPQKEKLICLWQKCGFTKSLNEIFKEDICCVQCYGEGCEYCNDERSRLFKDENTQALFDSLWEIFEDSITNKK